MADFCGFIKLIFLLFMLTRIPSNETRSLKGNTQANSDLIAGNEFLKLFMDHDQLDKDFYSSEYVAGSGEEGSSTRTDANKRKGQSLPTKKEQSFDKKSAETGRRSTSGRSVKDRGPVQNQAEGQLEDSKQVVKLVTSGSKIIFLEDYDENDAILDAEVIDIDLKKEIFKNKSRINLNDYEVVAVSVSSSSQRGTTVAKNYIDTTSTSTKYSKMPEIIKKSTTAITPTTKMTTKVPLKMASTNIDNIAEDNFINRSHNSEFSIEEVEPLTMEKHKSRTMRHRSYPVTSEALDSENSASSNINNILPVPLPQVASARSISTMTTTYRSGQRNMTINHNPNLHGSKTRRKTMITTTIDNDNSNKSKIQQPQQHIPNSESVGIEDQLLPFQTVIYHDTKTGHGPQSRSISYSSISQNVEDLKKWQQSGILAEARRNVSESLKPMLKSNRSSSSHQEEPSKLYSQPSKMYSEPSKFYSEPSKVYSEPAKIYGEPEKFYSEPAKVYGQPSKFYSEPSKVYSQPAKVYSEPAKTYWPLSATSTTVSNSVDTTTPSTNTPTITTLSPMVNIHHASRKPAIVSRIAFGEAHSTTSTTTTSKSINTISSTSTPLNTTSRTYGSQSQHQYSRTYSSHRNSSYPSFNNENSSLLSSSTSSSSSSSSAPSRRILFNLDRLPYDLLNAPEPSIQQQQLLELQKSKRPQQTLTFNQQKQQQHHHNINPCLESAVSSLFSSSSLSAHPVIVKQQQQQKQQYALFSDPQQHSNQNAKGLPNGDLVRCVSEISHTKAATTADDDNSDGTFTTERSQFEELYIPTPEQNYEIEESVSVMTNGRTQSGGLHSGRNSFAQPTISPVHKQQHHGFKPNRQRTRIPFGTNVNNQQAEVKQQHNHHHHHHQLSQISYNMNANANVETDNRHNNAPKYDENIGDVAEDEEVAEDGLVKNNDYEDDEEGGDRDSPVNGNNDDEDSKVAYVVEGRNYRKYRVEEKTDDGFIVGEYGVVDHNDGNLRGVRYTADSTINPSLIQKALLTFLKLK